MIPCIGCASGNTLRGVYSLVVCPCRNTINTQISHPNHIISNATIIIIIITIFDTNPQLCVPAGRAEGAARPVGRGRGCPGCQRAKGACLCSHLLVQTRPSAPCINAPCCCCALMMTAVDDDRTPKSGHASHCERRGFGVVCVARINYH